MSSTLLRWHVRVKKKKYLKFALIEMKISYLSFLCGFFFLHFYIVFLCKVRNVSAFFSITHKHHFKKKKFYFEKHFSTTFLPFFCVTSDVFEHKTMFCVKGRFSTSISLRMTDTQAEKIMKSLSSVF